MAIEFNLFNYNRMDRQINKFIIIVTSNFFTNH